VHNINYRELQFTLNTVQLPLDCGSNSIGFPSNL